MKTNCLASPFVRTSFLATTCLFVWLPTVEVSSAVPVVQQKRFSEMPDPYFPGDSALSKKRSQKPLVTPIANPIPKTAPSLWNAPQTIVNAEIAAQESNPAIVWDAPLTDAPLSTEKILGNANPGDLGLVPMKMPSPQSAALKPIQPDANSIIREQNTPVRNFNSNSLGHPTQSLTGSTNDESTLGLSAGKSFEMVPRQPVKNEFYDGNSFSTKQAEPFTSQSTSDFGSASNGFGFGESFGTKPVETKGTQVAQDSLVSSGSANKSETLTPFEPGKVLAIVGGEPIFVGDLLFDINQMIEQYMPGAPADVKERERQKMIPQMLPKFVESKMLFLGTLTMLPDGADIEKVLESASKEFDDKALDKMIKGSGLKTSTEFDANLRAMGSSLRQLRRSWGQEQLTKYFLSQQLNVAIYVTHQEMLDSYRENIVSYAIPAKSRWEQVMIRFDRSSSRAAAKANIVKLGNEIVYGANLNAVAKSSSHGFLASEGGQHDWTSKDALVSKEVDDAIFSLPVGELSEIIESQDGYHVIRVIERTEATRKPFLDAQVKIKQRIEAEKRKQAFDKHIAQLKREIPVEYFLNEDAAKLIDAAIPKTVNR